MIRILTLILGLTLAFEVSAQFATGFGPRATEMEEAEETQSSLFRQPSAPEVVQEAPPPPAFVIPTPYRGTIRILASVNGDIITTHDVNERVRALTMTTGIPYNEQTRLLIINKVMQNTVDEKLKLQEAARNQIDITERDIDTAIDGFRRNNGISEADLEAMLKQYGVSKSVFREQMKADLAWMRVVRRRSNDTITQPEIQEALKLARRDADKRRFMLSEIIIPRQDAKNISELVEILRQDPRFELYASQFSQAPSASSGGRLGWVVEGQLPEALENVIQKLPEGGISDPILFNDEYHILRVERRFDPGKDTMPEPTAEDMENLLRNQRSERMAGQLLQSLRQRAAIEMRE